MWQQPASPAAREASGGLRISSPLTQGCHGTSDAAQTSSEPPRAGKARAVADGGGDHKTSPRRSAQGLITKWSADRNPSRLCMHSHTLPSQSYTQRDQNLPRGPAAINIEPVKGKNKKTKTNHWTSLLKSVLKAHPC